MVRVEGDGIDQHRERRPVGMVDGHLVLTNRLTILDGPQCRKLLKRERVSIHAQHADAVLLKKFAHGLSRQPGRSQYRCRSTIGEYQSCISPTDQVDTAGQFVQNQLQQGPTRFRLEHAPDVRSAGDGPPSHHARRPQHQQRMQYMIRALLLLQCGQRAASANGAVKH